MTAVPTEPDSPSGPCRPAATEHAVVLRARAGDPSAFRIIFEQHAQAVRRFLRDLLAEDGAADEATQETFVRAYSRLGALREERQLSSWLFGIARNVAFEQLRARRRVRVTAAEVQTELADGALTPEAALLGEESERLLAEALGRLSVERRAALLLRLDHGLAYEDIVIAMGWTLQKVKNEIHRARLELRAHLRGYVGGAT